MGEYLKPQAPARIVENKPIQNNLSKPPRIGLKINPKDGAALIFIPAGEFIMGSNDGNGDEKPLHKVTLSGYYIYKTPVTVGMYEKFCKETNHPMPPEPDHDGAHFNPNWSKKDHPIVNVSWNDAMAYCQWAGVKLPTEAQWEKAARGTDGRKFPWVGEFDINNLWCSKEKGNDAGGTAPVGSYPSGASPFGVLDMAGNVWQWCADYYDESFYSSRRMEQPNPENNIAGTDGRRVLRGGSWEHVVASNYFRAAARLREGPSHRGADVGFRCALNE